MSTNKLSHLKEWEKIYLEVTREISTSDDSMGLMFCWTSGYTTFVDDGDTFYTLDDLKQLANDGMPKHGEMIEARYKTWVEWKYIKWKFICMYGWFVLVDDNDLDAPDIYCYDEWRFLPKVKTELTLAEVEERLGLEKGSLIIK